MEKFVQKVNLKLVKKDRKYWTVIQHWKGRGKALRKLENWIKEHNQLSEGERVNLNLSDVNGNPLLK